MFDQLLMESIRQRADSSFAHDWYTQGLNTDTPYLQVDNLVFKGEYQESFGSDMIFVKAPAAGVKRG
jgi:hypothetical protein